MKVELHVIQNFAPNCLNRDDTNTPKDCDFGGHRRARVSSQCFKRAMRIQFEGQPGLEPDTLSVRTRRLQSETADALGRLGHSDREQNLAVAEIAMNAASLKLAKKEGVEGPSQYLLFMPRRTIDAFVAYLNVHWDDFVAEVGKKAPKVEKAHADELVRILFDATRTPAIALFGRMIADAPEHNVEAACQVAHALSTHAVATEFDFFTAVDDLQESGDTGAGMMGNVGFQSSCLYRYAVLDVTQLRRNLAGGDPDEAASPDVGRLAADATRGFVQSMARAIPSGKQNSMAAHNPPSFVLAVVRDSGAPLSLANAFVKPVRARLSGDDLVTGSIRALDEHFGAALTMLGVNGIRLAAFVTLERGVTEQLVTLRPADSPLPDGCARQLRSLEDLVQAIGEALVNGGAT